jgi:hypothetical protein
VPFFKTVNSIEFFSVFLVAGEDRIPLTSVCLLAGVRFVCFALRVEGEEEQAIPLDERRVVASFTIEKRDTRRGKKKKYTDTHETKRSFVLKNTSIGLRIDFVDKERVQHDFSDIIKIGTRLTQKEKKKKTGFFFFFLICCNRDKYIFFLFVK